MKAALVTKLEGADGIEIVEIEPVAPGPGEVVVAVAACALNFMDTLITRGKYQIKPELPFSPSAEMAGTISSLGDGVTGWSVGDRVMAYAGFGAARAEVAISADRLVRVPDAVPLELAAGLTVTYGTALYALLSRCGIGRNAHDRYGHAPVVAVLGASGGAGIAAIEVAKLFDARVIAAAGTSSRVQLACDHGADVGIAYDEIDDLKAALREASGGAGPDIIYDCVGGDYAEPALRALRPGGDYVVIGFAGGGIPKLPANIILLKDCNVRGIHWGAHVEASPEHHNDNMHELLAALVDGRLIPRAPDVRPLEQIADAVRDIAARKTIGKIVLTP